MCRPIDAAASPLPKICERSDFSFVKRRRRASAGVSFAEKDNDMAKKLGTNPEDEIGTPLLAQSGDRDRAKPSAFGGKADIV